LRDIQEAESKKSEARKAAEKMKANAAAALSANASGSGSGADETLMTGTTSWGLPQVNSRAVSTGVVPQNTAATAAAWTKPGQTSKKTMKEIQEEEEKRKKAVAAKDAMNVAQSAAKRAYAESAKVRQLFSLIYILFILVSLLSDTFYSCNRMQLRLLLKVVRGRRSAWALARVL